MIVLVQCTDRVGLVAVITSTLAQQGMNIVSMREYVDTADNRFYLRLETTGLPDAAALSAMLANALPADAVITINPNPDKKIIVLATKEYHCLSDILVRNHFNTLNATVQCVIGNHPHLQDISERFGVPFHFVDHQHKTKEVFEQQLLAQINSYPADYLVLAKFMRILSPAFNALYPERIINIHHSFLPAFAGARPYLQAFERGVKVIGATAHFVTNDLDEGPIIVQQTINVNHTYAVADMVRAGKEIETATLAKALQLVFNDRVFVYGNKTVVFE